MIFKNEIREFGYTISSATAFALPATSATLGIMRPDGTTDTYTNITVPVVSVSPGTSALAQTIKITLPMNQAGVWRFEWGAAIGGEVKLFEELYFVAFSDVWSFIRNSVFNLTASRLSDASLDPFLSSISLAIVNAYPCIASYDSLTWPDTMHFDRAMAYIAGEAIYNTNPQNYARGSLSQITQGPVTYRYNIPRSNNSIDLYTGAWSELNQIACIKSAFNTFSSGEHLYSLYGRGRAIKESRGITVDSDILLQLSDPGFLYSLIPAYGWSNVVI